ncbi:EAL domain-containing protein [Vagococcus sp. WN89Y]|uniref:EAL domain-containing protein n=1 Tax=Vagococcus sp. WN89Y TaxID=3457258 RepID=UPI003FCE6345
MLKRSTRPISRVMKTLVAHVTRSGGEPSPLEALKTAIARGEFEPWFQPVVSSDTRECCGCEVLMRWRHPLMGIIPPEQFIPLAESSGLIVPMTQSLLTQVQTILSPLGNQLPDNFHVGVNISPEHITQPHFVDECLSFVAAFPPQKIKLVLELTERDKMPMREEIKARLKTLKKEGILFALDDFGTGYATHSYLQYFPVDFIKIDKSFVQMLDVDEISGHIVENVVDLAIKLNISVVAEGVENEQQAAFLVKKGVEFLQGFLFSAPLTKELFIKNCLTPEK